MATRLPFVAAFAALSACAAAAPPDGSPPGPCPVLASSQWSAWVNVMPGPMNHRGALHVVGMVTLPSGEWSTRLTDRRVLESYPVQVVVELEATRSGAGIQVPVEREVRGSWPSEERVGSVTVMCRGTSLARIHPVGPAR